MSTAESSLPQTADAASKAEKLTQALKKIVQGDLPTERLKPLAAEMATMLDEAEFIKMLQTPAHALSLALEVSDEALELVRELALRRTRKFLGTHVDSKLLDKIVLPDDSLRQLVLHPERMPEQASTSARATGRVHPPSGVGGALELKRVPHRRRFCAAQCSTRPQATS